MGDCVGGCVVDQVHQCVGDIVGKPIGGRHGWSNGGNHSANMSAVESVSGVLMYAVIHRLSGSQSGWETAMSEIRSATMSVNPCRGFER